MLAGVNIGLMELSAAEEKRGYHHGDLRNALITAAAELAQKGGGPTSVTIRAAAREVGVTPTAAYRHFANHDELLDATKDRAIELMGMHMHAELVKRKPVGDPVRAALSRLAAVGRGYLSFAHAEPGLFRTVFAPGGSVMEADTQREDDNPFQMLLACLDELVAVGYLAPSNRELAEVSTWAIVHGLAMLFDGPLRAMPEEVRGSAIVHGMLTLGHGLAANALTPEQEKLLAVEMRGGLEGRDEVHAVDHEERGGHDRGDRDGGEDGPPLEPA
jgi:AcrR family transcriptional regulator